MSDMPAQLNDELNMDAASLGYMSPEELEESAIQLGALIASSAPDSRAARALAKVTSDDGRECFAVIAAMSAYNIADTPLVRGRLDSPPWLVALVRDVLRGCEWGDETMRPTSRHVLPVYDGDRPSDLTDKMLAEARSWEPEYRNRCRTRDQRALVLREAIHDRGRGDGYAASVRETHAVVHAALAGEDPTWCTHCYPGALAGTHSRAEVQALQVKR